MLTNVRFLNSTHLTGVLPALSNTGFHALTVINPDGKSATLQNAFELTKLVPSVSKVRPAFGVNTFANILTVSGSGFTNGSVVKISNGTVNTLETQFVSPSILTATIPSSFQAGSYSLSVTNPDSQTSQVILEAYTSQDNTHEEITPLENGIWFSPNTLISGNPAQIGITLHRQGGKAIYTNLTISFYVSDLTPANKLGDAQIASLEPDQDASSTSITWNTPAAGNYTILAKIDPSGVFKTNHPDVTLPSGAIQQTVRILPRSVDSTPPVIQDLIIGAAGMNSTDSQEVLLHTIAVDPNNGSGVASLLYTESTYSQSSGSWTQVNSSGWIPVSADPYTWQLSPGSGVKYLQVWAADKMGNVSQPFGGWINYIPPSTTVLQGMTHVFRFHLAEGQRLTAALQPGTSDDADLFLWAKIAGTPTLLAWSNQDAGITDSISYTAPAGGMDVQLEVYGFTRTTYQLTSTVETPQANTQSIRETLTKEVPQVPAVKSDSVPSDQVKVPDAPISNIIRYNYFAVFVRVVLR
jgi:hypothetical protein